MFGSTATLAATTVALLLSSNYVSVLASDAANPKVLGLEFTKKSYADNTVSGLQRRQSSSDSTFAATLGNAQDIFYYINLNVGTPGQAQKVQVDTGSSDLWLLASTANICTGTNADCPYGTYDSDKSSTYRLVDQGGFNITYLLGDSDTGDFINETLSIGAESISDVTMGLVYEAAQGDSNGIMGVGYLTGEASAQSENFTYPNFLETLYDDGVIDARAFSLYLNEINSSTGTILFGGVDTSKYTGPLIATPIHADVWTGIIDSYDAPLTSVQFLSNSSVTTGPELVAEGAIIPLTLDSGATDLVIPNDLAAEIYMGVGAITSGSGYGGATIPCSYGEFSPSSLAFQFGGSTGPRVSVPLSEFVIPLTNDDGSPATDPNTGVKICRFGVSFADDGPGVLGDVFLRSAYVVYDIENNQLAIAQASYGGADSNSSITAIGTDGSIPGVSMTVTASPATAIMSEVAAQDTNPSVAFASASEFAVVAATPTFDLGLTVSQTAASGSASSTSAASGGREGGTYASRLGMGVVGLMVLGQIWV